MFFCGFHIFQRNENDINNQKENDGKFNESIKKQSSTASAHFRTVRKSPDRSDDAVGVFRTLN